jgi:peptide/nickel transport system permease protein
MTERRTTHRSYWRLVGREFVKRRMAVAALAVTGLLIAVALAAPYLANDAPIVLHQAGAWYFPSTFTYARFQTADWPAFVENLEVGDWVLLPPVGRGPNRTEITNRLAAPSRAHPFGTDDLGRDVLARMIWGARISLSVGFVAVGIAVLIGIALGAVAGYFMGLTDLVISRIIEVVICFPVFFLILIIIAIVPVVNIYYLMFAIGIVGWTGVARFVRAEFFKLRVQDFTIAARALGAPTSRIIFRHILPNAIAPVLVSATFGIAGAILTESGLSFLGFGVPPPTASWGSILSLARQYVYQAWWLTAFPGAAIFLSIVCYNLVGEGLRDAVDPRLKI